MRLGKRNLPPQGGFDQEEENSALKFRPLSEIYPGGAALAFTYLPSSL